MTGRRPWRLIVRARPIARGRRIACFAAAMTSRRPGRVGRARSSRWAVGDDGNAPLELVLLAPIILILIGLMIAAGRTSIAQGAVDAAAREAARQASLAPDEGAAVQAALVGAADALQADGLQCQPRVFLPGLAVAFATSPGQPAEVRARVVCVVRLSDLVVPGVPGSIRLTANFTSPLDPYRSRDLAAGNPAARPGVTVVSHLQAQTHGQRTPFARSRPGGPPTSGPPTIGAE
jgi:hypothetical protein